MFISEQDESEAATYRCTPYGEMTITRSGSPQGADPLGQDVGYTGRWYDAEAGLWQYRFRAYTPALGRFLQRDPLGILTGPCAYAYVSSRVPTLRDPLGLREEKVLLNDDWRLDPNTEQWLGDFDMTGTITIEYPCGCGCGAGMAVQIDWQVKYVERRTQLFERLYFLWAIYEVSDEVTTESFFDWLALGASTVATGGTATVVLTGYGVYRLLGGGTPDLPTDDQRTFVGTRWEAQAQVRSAGVRKERVGPVIPVLVLATRCVPCYGNISGVYWGSHNLGTPEMDPQVGVESPGNSGGWQPWDHRVRPDGPGKKRPGTGDGSPYPTPYGKREGG